MKSDELEDVFRLVEALWRNQKFRAEELTAWRRTLASYDFDVVSEVLESFATAGTKFIPDLPELHEALRAHMRRLLRAQPPPERQEPESSPQGARQWLSRCRDQLASL